MKKLLVVSAVLVSMVFASMGVYANPIPEGIAGTTYGVFYSLDKMADIQANFGMTDDKDADKYFGVKGTYYFMAKDAVSVGAFAAYDRVLTGDADDFDADLALGVSAKWQLNKAIALKTDVTLFGMDMGKTAGDSNEGWVLGVVPGNPLAPNGSVKVSVMFDLF